jgi:hypothetical protein
MNSDPIRRSGRLATWRITAIAILDPSGRAQSNGTRPRAQPSRTPHGFQRIDDVTPTPGSPGARASAATERTPIATNPSAHNANTTGRTQRRGRRALAPHALCRPIHE